MTRQNSGGTTRIYYDSCGVFEGVLTVDDYEPYAGYTIPLIPDGYSIRSLPDGTRDELTLTYLRPSAREGWAWYDRELAQAVGYVADMSTLDWSSQYSDAKQKWIAPIIDMHAYIGANKFMCTSYESAPAKAISATVANGTIATMATSNRQVFVRNDLYATAAQESEFVESMSGVEFVYLLDTPTTTTLDPIELPVLPSKHVTVWSDPTTDLKLIYVIDSETIEESLESGIGKAFSSVAPVETSPATDNHDVGSRIVYNETLYKVTSAIAAGEDIVPGTNVTATTVAAELLATQA